MTQTIEQRIEELGYTLPAPFPIPEGMVINFSWVNIIGSRCLVSGHVPLNDDGTIALPIGKVGANLTLEEGIHAGKMAALAMVSTLKRELGDLGRIKSWTKVLGMVHSAPDFYDQTPVINGFSDTIAEIWGDAARCCVRSAVGMVCLPYGVPVEVEAELELHI